MAKIKIGNIPFTGTAEQENELRAKLAELKSTGGALMLALQTAQNIYGYLPIEVQKMIAEELSVSLEEVFGVATFYSQFKLSPKGQYEVAVCLGTACYVKGAGAVMDKVAEILGIEPGSCTADAKFSIAATRCIGCCGLAPVMTVNSDVYGKLTPDQIPAILAKYKA